MTIFTDRIVASLLLLFALLAAPAAADWLVTAEGRLIETDGPWEIEDQTLTYTDHEGQRWAIDFDEVDLEASEETTAYRAGKPYVRKSKEEADDENPAEAVEDGDPQVTLYMTSWCGYCRKTRRLLEQLDADFVEKDIEKNRQAANEFRQKSGGRSGVPLLDIGGQVIRGYQPEVISKLVRKLQREEQEAL